MDSTLIELYKHNKWANLRLLDACEGLSDEQLEASTLGTFGSIRRTLIHILGAEERYVFRLTGKLPEKELRDFEGFPGFEELRVRAQQSGDALVGVASNDPDKKFINMMYNGALRDVRATVILIQAINHATEHRSQVMTTITQLAIEPPDVSGWSYGEAMEY